jgi:serine beta-lactamase-like protein LACTB, mitochondrial
MHRSSAAIAFTILLASACVETVNAQVEPDILGKGRELVGQYLAETGTPGLAVAIGVGDSLVWVEGFGLADVEHNVPVQIFTRFRIASVSKSLTSAAVGLLHEQGLLDLDIPVQTYVPSFPEKGYPITTRDLGAHLSGLPHYEAEDFVNLTHYENVVGALDKFKDRPLLFQPRQRFHYSSFGYNLISAVVEGAAGKSFLEYMEAAVFRPLGMVSTEADRYTSIIPHRTSYYEVTVDGELRHAPFTDSSDVWAAGGFLSTPRDLVVFGSAMLNNELLEPETTALLFERSRTADGEVTESGLGWFFNEVDGHATVGHTGGHFGASAFLLMIPEQQIVIAAAANAAHERFYPMVVELARLFLRE